MSLLVKAGIPTLRVLAWILTAIQLAGPPGAYSRARHHTGAELDRSATHRAATEIHPVTWPCRQQGAAVATARAKE